MHGLYDDWVLRVDFDFLADRGNVGVDGSRGRKGGITPNAIQEAFAAELDKMMVVQPDYVLIQYGYMDSAGGSGTIDPDATTTVDEFAANLKTIVNLVRSFNGVPVLVTLHAARIWDANGKVIPSWQERNNVTKKVASDLNTLLIDLNQLSTDLFNKLGPSCASWMHVPGYSADDVMHLSALGAQYVAQLVVNAFPDNLGPYLTGIFDPPPKP